MQPHKQDIKIDMKLSKYEDLIKELANEINSLEEPQNKELTIELAKYLSKESNEELLVELINYLNTTMEYSEVSKHLAKEINKN